MGAEYSIYMRAYTQSMYIESFQYPGNKSEIIHILAGKDCDRVQVMFILKLMIFYELWFKIILC